MFTFRFDLKIFSSERRGTTFRDAFGKSSHTYLKIAENEAKKFRNEIFHLVSSISLLFILFTFDTILMMMQR